MIKIDYEWRGGNCAKCTQSKSKCEGVFRPTTLQREDTFRT